MIEIREKLLRRRGDEDAVTERISVSAKVLDRHVMLHDIEDVASALVADLVQIVPPLEGHVRTEIEIVHLSEVDVITAIFERKDGQSSTNAESLGYRETSVAPKAEATQAAEKP